MAETQDTRSVRVVVAHFNESLRWLEAIPKDYAITISSAGDSPVIPAGVEAAVEKTPNGGREAGQWFRWIVRNYDNLDDVVLFLQGSPFTGHTPEILLQIQRDKITYPFDYFGSRRPFSLSVGKGWQFGEMSWIVPPELHVPAFSCGVWGGQHYATREILRRRPVELYKRLSDISLENSKFSFGHACEYFFNVIYGVTIDEVQ